MPTIQPTVRRDGIAGSIRTNPLDPERKQIESVVAKLVSFQHRGSGTREERLASLWVRQQLDELALKTELQEFRCSGSYGLRIFIHLILGLFGLAMSGWLPFVSWCISIVTLVSFILDTSGKPIGISNLLPKSSSQNVFGVAPADGLARKRMVVCAHIDTQQTGWIWSSSSLKFFTSTFGLLPGPLKAPLVLVTIAMLVQIMFATLLMTDLILQLPVVVLVGISFTYLLAIILVGQWSLGAFVPGANDNATGVACALALANRWRLKKHDDTELIVLITGCEEPGLIGAANWARKIRDLFSTTLPTCFVNLDLLGCRDLHFLKSECALNGWIVRYPQEMLDVGHAVAKELGLPFPNPHTIPTHTDGLAFLANNIPGITLTSSESGTFVPHYHTMEDRLENVNFESVEKATEFAWQIMTRLESQP